MSKLKLYTLGYTLFQNGNMIDIEKMFNTLKSFKVCDLILLNATSKKSGLKAGRRKVYFIIFKL